MPNRRWARSPGARRGWLARRRPMSRREVTYLVPSSSTQTKMLANLLKDNLNPNSDDPAGNGMVLYQEPRE